MTAAALAVILVLQPVLEADGPLRVVAADIGEHEVAWVLDGVEVARTQDREAASLAVAAGAHDLKAVSAANGRWMAMARPDGGAQGAAFVPAWSAVHEAASDRPDPEGGPLSWPRPPLALSLGIASLLLLLWPRRRGLEALRRPRRR